MKVISKTFNQIISEAPSYSISECTDYAKFSCTDSEFGISVTAFAALVINGKIPSFKKVPQELNYDVQLAAFRYAFSKKPEVIQEMPAGIMEALIKEDENFIMNAYNNSYLRDPSFGRKTWIGYQILKLIDEEYFKTSDIFNIQDDILERFKQKDGALSTSEIPDFLVTEEMDVSWVKIYGQNLRFIPKQRITQRVCEAAVNQTGAALEYVPEEYQKQFYLDAVRTGKALSSIPTEDITENFCAIAVEANSGELRNVPEEMKSYLICLHAIDKNAELIEFVPDKHIDQEMITRLVISILRGNFEYNFALNSVSQYKAERGQKEPLLTTVFNEFFETQEGSRERKIQMINLSSEIIKRDANLYFKLLDFSGENDKDSGSSRFRAGDWEKYFRDCVIFQHAIIAAETDINVVGGFKLDVQKAVWKHYLAK